ncbi:pentapeptide repeat-containing protein [Nocardia sp. CS682]|uniref:pentapeptide repeat-containing protein n=1 Tax=Nocardia sp. CS682 TaxID=1047172 RepID=UPI001075877E
MIGNRFRPGGTRLRIRRTRLGLRPRRLDLFGRRRAVAGLWCGGVELLRLYARDAIAAGQRARARRSRTTGRRGRLCGLRGTGRGRLGTRLLRLGRWRGAHRVRLGRRPGLPGTALSTALRSARLPSSLRSARLSATNLRSARLSATNVRSARLSATNVRSTRLSATNLRNARLPATNLRSTRLRATSVHSRDRGTLRLRVLVSLLPVIQPRGFRTIGRDLCCAIVFRRGHGATVVRSTRAIPGSPSVRRRFVATDRPSVLRRPIRSAVVAPRSTGLPVARRGTPGPFATSRPVPGRTSSRGRFASPTRTSVRRGRRRARRSGLLVTARPRTRRRFRHRRCDGRAISRHRRMHRRRSLPKIPRLRHIDLRCDAATAEPTSATCERTCSTRAEHVRIEFERAAVDHLVGETTTDHTAETTSATLHEAGGRPLVPLVELRFGELAAQTFEEVATDLAEQRTERTTHRTAECVLTQRLTVETVLVSGRHLAELKQDIEDHLLAHGIERGGHHVHHHDLEPLEDELVPGGQRRLRPGRGDRGEPGDDDLDRQLYQADDDHDLVFLNRATDLVARFGKLHHRFRDRLHRCVFRLVGEVLQRLHHRRIQFIRRWIRLQHILDGVLDAAHQRRQFAAGLRPRVGDGEHAVLAAVLGPFAAGRDTQPLQILG